MRRIPEFLPPVLWDVHSHYMFPVGAIREGMDIPTHYVPDTQMVLVLFESPALIYGLLMTEVKLANDKIERFFFGYRCVGCERIYLVEDHIRRVGDLHHVMRHRCDPSELRKAVRNARFVGLERGENIIEGPDGNWWAEMRRDKWGITSR